MEEFDLYDKSFNKLNKTMLRGETKEQGEYHLVSHIWIKNSEGKYLIQQRNKIEDINPYRWASTGGAVLKGETSIEGTLRELYEELGLELEPSDLKLLKRYFVDNSTANFITDLYLIEKDIELDTLTLDINEVKDVAYKTMQEIKEMIIDNQFWDYTHFNVRDDYFDIVEKG